MTPGLKLLTPILACLCDRSRIVLPLGSLAAMPVFTTPAAIVIASAEATDRPETAGERAVLHKRVHPWKASPPNGSDRTQSSELLVEGEGIVTAKINDVSLQMRIDPGAVAMPLITAAAAERTKLKAGPFNFEYLIGPRRVTGKSAVARINFGQGTMKRRVGWTDAPYSSGVEGIIGPGLLPEKLIRFQLRPSQEGESTISLPMVGQGGLESRWGSQFAMIEIGGAPMRIQFEPARKRSIATANAGVRIAAAYSGQLSSETQHETIVFGVKRPVRSLRLKYPLKIGSLLITDIGVRTADFGSIKSIEAKQNDTLDPDEIVVTGVRKKGKNFDYILLGRDQLDRCSSIIFDKTVKEIRLTCR